MNVSSERLRMRMRENEGQSPYQRPKTPQVRDEVQINRCRPPPRANRSSIPSQVVRVKVKKEQGDFVTVKARKILGCATQT